jgi:LuxR family maltose regulon positive regulatory protein
MRNLGRLSRAIALDGRPLTLVVDNLHGLREQRAIDVIATLAEHVPETWRIGLATREPLDLPTIRWRTKRMLVELRLADLAMDETECVELLGLLGLEVSADIAQAVVARTEGWPAGVYLAGLSLKMRDGETDSTEVSGADDLIRSYIEFEMLADLEPETERMLVQTSIVDSVSGPLADTIAGMSNAGTRLYDISRRNQLVIPLDTTRRWFRYHGLLRDVLARRLEDAPADGAAAHERAAGWFESEGRLDEAIDHAIRAGDTQTAIRLVSSAARLAFHAGELLTIQRWISLFSVDELAGERQLPMLAALVAAMEGDPRGVTAWTAVAQRAGGGGAGIPDPLDESLLRAVVCRDGPDTMLADARRSLGDHHEDSTWRPIALLAAGGARAMLDDAHAAEQTFAEAEQMPAIASAMGRFALRGERALMAAGRRDWQDVELTLGLDRAAITTDPDAGRAFGLIWLVADARLAIHRGNMRVAGDRLRRADAGRAWLSWAMPWYAVRTLTELARAQLLIGDSRAALDAVAQARVIADARPSLGTLTLSLDDVSRRSFSHSAGLLPHGSTLTPAELRLLPLLQTYLTFKEVAERLRISSNTVKTEAMAIYAKLGAASRSEAIATAVEYGLLEDIFA